MLVNDIYIYTHNYVCVIVVIVVYIYMYDLLTVHVGYHKNQHHGANGKRILYVVLLEVRIDPRCSTANLTGQSMDLPYLG